MKLYETNGILFMTKSSRIYMDHILLFAQDSKVSLCIGFDGNITYRSKSRSVYPIFIEEEYPKIESSE